MHPSTSPKKHSWLSPRQWLTLLVLALGALGMALLIRGAPEPQADRAEPGATARSRTPYRNRAMWNGSPAGEPEAQAAPAITGHIFGLDGVAIPGATVVATTFEVAGNLPSVAGTARSDEAGRFELQLPDGAYQLQASREGYGPSQIPAYSGEDISLVLPRSGAVEGRVLGESGAPVREFTIDVLTLMPDDQPAPAPLFSKRFESADGSFHVDQLPLWAVVLRATAEGRAPAFSEQIAVRPGDTKKVDLKLEVGCTVAGMVVEPDGTPVPGVFLDAESRLAAGSMGDMSIEAAKQGESDEEGRFVLSNVPTGDVVVRGYEGESAVSTAALRIESCDAVPPVRLVMTDGGGISGVVRRSDGKPLAGARLTLTQRAVGAVNATSDAAGRYTFDQIPAGQVRLELRHEGRFSAVFVEVKDGSVAERDLVLSGEGDGEIRGQITAGSRPIPGFRLMVVTNRGEAQGLDMIFPVTDAEGNYHVPSIPDGTYIVSAMTTRKAGTVTVKAGEAATLDLDVTPRERPVAQRP